jgi:ferredoxin
MVTKVRVVADRRRCAGSGQCALRLPAVFDQRDTDGRVALIEEYPDEALLPALHQAADRCPSRAIKIVTA